MLPLIQEIAYQDPSLVLKYFSDQEWLCFLDSAKQLQEIGQFSFIVFNPFLKITAKKNLVTIDDISVEGDPFLILKEQLSHYKVARKKNFPPFQGGALGYFSYDLLHHLENVPRHQSEAMALPEMMIGLYDTVIAFNHQTKSSWICAQGLAEKNPELQLQQAEKSCHFILDRLNQPMVATSINKKSFLTTADTIKSNFTKQSYQETVQKVIDYIYDGDIFQANISQCFSLHLPENISSLDLYFQLREKNPAPFAAFLNYGDFAIVSASPERFLKLTDHVVETRPIKGTRRRSLNPVDDKVLAAELKNSAKDIAENTMIVDLMRNDLSRVCINHSVQVNKLCDLETYATVHHLVSTIQGQLQAECDAIDLLRATFPGGSITGAPKIRSMEIIAELEPTARGPYCGSIGYIGFDGSMDTSIVIRSYAVKGNALTFQAGGGIVADSSPEDEYQETLAKAASLLNVLTEDL